MSLSAVTCPQCQTLLRSSRPIPVGINLRCPECKTTFLSRAPVFDDPFEAPPAPRLFGPAFFIAVGIAGTLGLSIITAALIYASRSAAPTPVAAVPAAPAPSDRSDYDRARAELDNIKRHVEAERLVLKGDAALAKQQYREAEEHFQAALRLAPKLAEALKGRDSARAGLARARKADEDRARAKKTVAELLAEARTATAAKKHAAAVRALESARALEPANADVLAALDTAKAAVEADDAEKKNLADFRKHMDAGQVAMKAENFSDALREYLAAARLMPDDLEAQQGKKQAENKLADVADKEKKRDAFDALVARGKEAMKETRYGDAVASFQGAVKVNAGDKLAARDLRDAEAELKRARSENAKLLAQANEAAARGDTDEAVRLSGLAVKNWAEDAKAKKALANAEKLAGAKKTTQNTYLAAAQQGSLGLPWLGPYMEPARFFPTEWDVARSIVRARREIGRDLLDRREALRLRNAGTVALSRRSFAEAEKLFRQALRKDPGDLLAANGLSEARYERFMVEGKAAFNRKQRAEAVRAFTAAAAEKPGDLMANGFLRQAKLLR